MEDYEDIRRRLLEKRRELLGRISAIADDAGHAGRPLDPDFEEQAVDLQNEEVLGALDAAARHELDQIERAMQRMDRGEYDVCAVCGNEIPLQRLRVLPFTDRCLACAERAAD